MALSTVDIPDYSMRGAMQKAFCILILALYGALCLTSYFPALHNHGPLATHTCCCDCEKSCDISHNHAHHNPAAEFHSDGQLVQTHGPCMACMWQSMAKREAASHFAPQMPTLLLQQEYDIPSNPHYCTSLRLQQSRAPPA